MRNIEQFKSAIKDKFEIYKDANAPVAVVDGSVRVVMTIRATGPDDLITYLEGKGHKNVAFYKIVGSGIRFCSW